MDNITSLLICIFILLSITTGLLPRCIACNPSSNNVQHVRIDGIWRYPINKNELNKIVTVNLDYYCIILSIFDIYPRRTLYLLYIHFTERNIEAIAHGLITCELTNNKRAISRCFFYSLFIIIFGCIHIT